MADIYARMTQIVGTTSDWSSSALVLGDGELGVEVQADRTILRIGDGVTPALQCRPIADGFYQIATPTEIILGTGQNNVVIPSQLAAASTNVFTSAADAGKFVKLDGNGMIDTGLLPQTVVNPYFANESEIVAGVIDDKTIAPDQLAAASAITSSGAIDDGKYVRLDPTGKIHISALPAAGISTEFTDAASILAGVVSDEAIAPDQLNLASVIVSAGVADAGKWPRLDANGLLDASVVPVASISFANSAAILAGVITDEAIAPDQLALSSTSASAGLADAGKYLRLDANGLVDQSALPSLGGGATLKFVSGDYTLLDSDYGNIVYMQSTGKLTIPLGSGPSNGESVKVFTDVNASIRVQSDSGEELVWYLGGSEEIGPRNVSGASYFTLTRKAADTVLGHGIGSTLAASIELGEQFDFVAALAEGVTDFQWTDNGNRFYLLNTTLRYRHYSAGTPYDLSTLSFVEEDINGGSYGFYINEAGTRLIDNDSSNLQQHVLNPAWDITLTNSQAVSIGAVRAQGMRFSPDGLYLGYAAIALGQVRSRKVTTPFDGTTNIAGSETSYTYTGDITSLDNLNDSMIWAPDGLSFLLGIHDDQKIYQYDLIVPWNLETCIKNSYEHDISADFSVVAAAQMSFSFSDDGYTLYCSNDEISINSYSLSMPYRINSIDVPAAIALLHSVQFDSTYSDQIKDFQWSDNGNKLHIISFNDGFYNTYNAAVPYAISTLTIAEQNVTGAYNAFLLDETGTILLDNNSSNLDQHTLTTPFDLSTQTNHQAVDIGAVRGRGMAFSSDGLMLGYAATTVREVRSRPLTVAYDATTNVSASQTAYNYQSDVGSTDILRDMVLWAPDGLSFILYISIDKKLYQYDLTTAWDLTTCSKNAAEYNLVPDIGTLVAEVAIRFNNDGRLLFVCSNRTQINTYLLGTPYRIG